MERGGTGEHGVEMTIPVEVTGREKETHGKW
jgi:hypothetical protein